MAKPSTYKPRRSNHSLSVHSPYNYGPAILQQVQVVLEHLQQALHHRVEVVGANDLLRCWRKQTDRTTASDENRHGDSQRLRGTSMGLGEEHKLSQTPNDKQIK